MTLERYEKIARGAKEGEWRLLADTLLKLIAEVRNLHEVIEPIRERAPSPNGECSCGGSSTHAMGCPTMVRLFIAGHPPDRSSSP